MSKILDIAHEMAKDLFEAGAMDEVTMRTVESLCLLEKKVFLPEDIRRIRTTNHLSQPVFALMLGIGQYQGRESCKTRAKNCPAETCENGRYRMAEINIFLLLCIYKACRL